MYYGSESGIEAPPSFTATGELALDSSAAPWPGGRCQRRSATTTSLTAPKFDHDTGKSISTTAGRPANETPVHRSGPGRNQQLRCGCGRGGDVDGDAMPMLSSVRRPTGGRAVRRQGLTSIWAAAGWLSLRPSSPRARMPATIRFQNGAGDVNGDGLTTAVGARSPDVHRAPISTPAAQAAQATPIFTATGEAANSNFGRSVSGRATSAATAGRRAPAPSG